MNRFLLVGTSRQAWRNILRDAVKPLGELDVCRESETLAQVEKAQYDVVIVDAGEVNHLEELVFQLRGQLPLLRIIVATAAPSWQLARQVFLSGATDYILKYADKKKLSDFLIDILDHAASPASPADSQRDFAPHDSQRDSTMQRVLIADNNEGFLNELADFLRSEGYSVITAKNLDQAKKALQKKNYDAVILDIRLRSDKDEKDISGLMLAKTIPQGIPAIILTRYPTVGIVRQALAPRLKGIPAAFDFVTKDELYDLLLPVLSDAIFVSDLQKGDSSAWKKLWSEESASVIALCRRHGLSRDDALRVCLKIFSESVRAPGYLLKRTALRKALINKAILEMRSPNERQQPKTSSSRSDPTGEILVNEQLLTDLTQAAVHGKIPPEVLINHLTQTIESLGPREQKVMMLHTFQGASRSKIAKHLGITEERVVKHLQDGSRKIRAKVAASDESWENLGESNIVPILFMDIVGYSKLRDIDQKDAIEMLIEIVKQALKETKYKLHQVVNLPTGDGMCLCFNTGTEGPLKVAAKVQTLLAKRKLKSQKRRIHVRMGIHFGNVLRIKDLKGSYNLAGAAINISQRAMNCGDQGHILCTKEAYEILRGMKDYQKALKRIKKPFIVKHDVSLRLYNYFREDEGFGNCNEPIR